LKGLGNISAYTESNKNIHLVIKDADSWAAAERDVGTSAGGHGHKKEGAFCVLTAEDIRAVLADHKIDGTALSLADLVMDRYHVREKGNVDPSGDPHGELRGQNVLTELPPPVKGGAKSLSPVAPSHNGLLADQPELYERSLALARRLLYERRLERPRPDRDDKVTFFVFC
jgi:uncharacterized protein YyaL (SSP411 family)